MAFKQTVVRVLQGSSGVMCERKCVLNVCLFAGDLLEDKVWMQEERQAAMLHAHQRAEEEKKAKATQKREAERYALKQQMKVIRLVLIVV